MFSRLIAKYRNLLLIVSERAYYNLRNETE